MRDPRDHAEIVDYEQDRDAKVALQVNEQPQDLRGDTMPVFDPTTGEEYCAHIFIAALGASNYTYAEARWTETLPDWIGAHVNAFAAIGGVPTLPAKVTAATVNSLGCDGARGFSVSSAGSVGSART